MHTWKKTSKRRLHLKSAFLTEVSQKSNGIICFFSQRANESFALSTKCRSVRKILFDEIKLKKRSPMSRKSGENWRLIAILSN